ncbi:zn 2cys6 transcription factor, partial [Paraphaeosphaeria sporulosa]
LDTEDLSLWREFGLLLNDNCFIVPNHAAEHAYSDSDTYGDSFGEECESTWAGVSQKTLLDYWSAIQRQFQMCKHTRRTKCSLSRDLVEHPHTTQGATNVYERLNSYQSVVDACQKHSREIVGISLGRPDEDVRIHPVQPLFTAGQCLSDIGERQVVLNVLRGVESDIGWATEYRARQLIEQWHWEDSDQALVT